MPAAAPDPATETALLSDEVLAARVRCGAAEAFEPLVERHHRRLYHFLKQKTADPRDAEDLTQRVFVTAYQKIALYDPARRFETWLYTIARRIAIDHYRYQSRRPRLFGEESERAPEPVEDANPADAIMADEDGRSLWAVVRSEVNDTQFTALWLRYQEDLPIAEIATAIGKSETNTKVLLHRARERLAKHLTADAREAAGGGAFRAVPAFLF